MMPQILCPTCGHLYDVAQQDQRRTVIRLCRCGHSMLLHDVADMDGTAPLCCVQGCDQRGCKQAGPSSPLLR